MMAHNLCYTTLVPPKACALFRLTRRLVKECAFPMRVQHRLLAPTQCRLTSAAGTSIEVSFS